VGGGIMGKKTTLSNTLLISMDSRKTGVTGLLSYDKNMLYLPLPDESKNIATSNSIQEDKVIIVPAKKNETAPERVNI